MASMNITRSPESVETAEPTSRSRCSKKTAAISIAVSLAAIAILATILACTMKAPETTLLPTSQFQLASMYPMTVKAALTCQVYNPNSFTLSISWLKLGIFYAGAHAGDADAGAASFAGQTKAQLPVNTQMEIESSQMGAFFSECSTKKLIKIDLHGHVGVNLGITLPLPVNIYGIEVPCMPPSLERDTQSTLSGYKTAETRSELAVIV
eukprot:TRINITY_DN32332_c0_g1_i1.p1 TRINITY_DN32332_c0_g1~~TRINITY_DN32332_c0_g1_i1.p1  ORF type:complete len:209 (+),score=37.88 TRINITY_DN32332_c0_g1_i1:59-685(+)